MTWLIIALVIVLAVGPVMYLLPSKRDKRLSALREQARAQGLSVRLTRIAKLDPDGTERVNAAGHTLNPTLSCVAYGRAVRANLVEFQDLLLLKLPAQPTVPYQLAIPGWAQADTQANGTRTVQEDSQSTSFQLLDQSGLLPRLGDLLTDFPADTVAVELSNRSIDCLWLENAEAESDSVAQITQTCQAIEKLLINYLEIRG